jgi:hypothetical protein
MAVLIDTNILLRSVQTHHPHFVLVERALAALRVEQEPLHVAVQNFIEFWTVATRPVTSNGLGMTTEAATQELAMLKDLFRLLAEPSYIFEEWGATGDRIWGIREKQPRCPPGCHDEAARHNKNPNLQRLRFSALPRNYGT